jgi:hypothetical protein
MFSQSQLSTFQLILPCEWLPEKFPKFRLIHHLRVKPSIKLKAVFGLAKSSLLIQDKPEGPRKRRLRSSLRFLGNQTLIVMMTIPWCALGNSFQ